MYEFWMICLLNVILLLQSGFILFYAGHVFLNIQLKGKSFIKELIIFSTFLSVFLSAISFISLSKQTYISMPIDILMQILQFGAYLIFIKRYLPNYGWSATILLLSIPSLLERFSKYVFAYFDGVVNYIISIDNVLIVQLLFFILVNILTTFILFILNKSHINKSIHILFNSPKLSCLIGSIIWIICLSSDITGISLMNNSSQIFLILSGVSILMFLIISIVAREVNRNNQLNYSKKLIKEQQKYVEHVETLYNDLQKIQHDYKNLLSGMYLQVSEGKIDDVKKYLSKVLLSTDKDLEKNLKQQKQLGNIKIIEVKSLLFTKIMMAKKYGVTLNIEVINPINALSMNINDFLRILGISIDNAIEATGKIKNSAVVDILFIHTNNYVEVVVKNPFNEVINKEKIWESGYSTKGKNRGLGLSTYKDILDSYSDVLRMTKISENKFTHTIIIPT